MQIRSLCENANTQSHKDQITNLDYFSNILVKDNEIKKVHQGLHLILNNLVRNCQSIGTWNLVASKHLYTSAIIITGSRAN